MKSFAKHLFDELCDLSQALPLGNHKEERPRTRLTPFLFLCIGLFFTMPSMAEEKQYTLMTMDKDKCADTLPVDGNIYEYDCHAQPNQLWLLRPVGGDPSLFLIVGVSTGKCMDKHPQNNNIYESPCHGGVNQQFRIQNTTGGYGQIESMHGGCLDASRSGAPHENIYAFPCHGGQNQQWKWVDQGSTGDSLSTEAGLSQEKAALEAEMTSLANEEAASLQLKQQKEEELRRTDDQIHQVDAELAAAEQELRDLEAKLSELSTTSLEQSHEYEKKTEEALALAKEQALLEAELTEKNKTLIAEAEKYRNLESQNSSLNNQKETLEGTENHLKSQTRTTEDHLEEANKEAMSYQDPNKILDLSLNLIRKLGTKTPLDPLFTQLGGIYRTSSEGEFLICNGFLVSKTQLRAPAHCLESSSNTTGEWVFKNLAEDNPILLSLPKLDQETNTATFSITSIPSDKLFPMGPLDPTQPAKLIYVDPVSKQVLSKTCKLEEAKGYEVEFLLHNCQTPKGSSGGIFIQNLSIVAIHQGRDPLDGEAKGVAVEAQKPVAINQVLPEPLWQ